MKTYFETFYGILLLRESPQALPASGVLLAMLICTAAAIDYAVGISVFPALTNAGRVLFDLAILLLFTQFVLQFTGLLPRFLQTASALCLAQMTVNLLSWPATLQFAMPAVQESGALRGLLGIITLSLIFYSVVLVSHVLKHALSATLLRAVMLAIAYHLIIIVLVGIVFPMPLVA